MTHYAQLTPYPPVATFQSFWTPIPTLKPITSSPTKRCGDSICKADENQITCPADCINAEFSTYGDNAGAKGSNGTMFTLEAKRDVEINSFYTFCAAARLT